VSNTENSPTRAGKQPHLNLRLAKGRGVGGDDDHLGLVVPERLGDSLEAQGHLPGFHHKLQLGIDAFHGLLRPLGGPLR